MFLHRKYIVLQMTIEIGFIWESSECGMTLFLAIYNTKPCPDLVSYLLIKLVVFVQVKAHKEE